MFGNFGRLLCLDLHDAIFRSDKDLVVVEGHTCRLGYAAQNTLGLRRVVEPDLYHPALLSVENQHASVWA